MALETRRAARWSASEAVGDQVASVLAAVAPLQRQIEHHQLYGRLRDLPSVRLFMEHHVFAVLDFMWLLKSLQRRLTCVDVPWIPMGSAGTRRFVNEIVLEEESDEYRGGWTSHFELYLRAMKRAGADTRAVEAFVEKVASGADPGEAVKSTAAPVAAQQFVETTWQFVDGRKDHEVAGAFAFGRENLIPGMFEGLLSVANEFPHRLDVLSDYVSRHIELDGQLHTPLAFSMVSELCEGGNDRWREVTHAAVQALESRLLLWEGASQAMSA